MQKLYNIPITYKEKKNNIYNNIIGKLNRITTLT